MKKFACWLAGVVAVVVSAWAFPAHAGAKEDLARERAAAKALREELKAVNAEINDLKAEAKLAEARAKREEAKSKLEAAKSKAADLKNVQAVSGPTH